ncbi:MAG: lysophospholipid acyltransferase family protein, partial [Chromatocurvus sp.]
PCIVVSAHLSNWEVIGIGMHQQHIPNTALYTPPSNPHLDRMLQASRAVMGCELVPRDNSARQLVRLLREGRSAAMAVDRRVDEGTVIDFFGHPKASTLLPARLSLKQGCALIPTRVERLRDARFRITFYPPIKAADPAADERERAIDMMQQLHRQFETWIREQPAEWLCSKRLWPRGTNATGGAVQSAGATRYNSGP